MILKMSKQHPPAPTASAAGPCPTIILIKGRPSTRSLPSTIALPDHPPHSSHFVFKSNNGFARFLVIKSMEEKAVTSLSPFVIEKQIESIIGTLKSVKKLKNKLLVETCRKSQTDNLLKVSTFFGLEYLSLSTKV